MARAAAAGVEKIVAVGCDLKSCDGARELAEKYPQVYATLGMHPYEAESVNKELLKKWEEEISKNKKIVAIGECGLDYFKAKVEKSVQKKAFEMQLEFAVKMGLPVIVHNRDADEDCLEILRKFPKARAVFHCFAGDLNFAEKIWAAGYMTSFTGIVTYPRAEKLREVLNAVPPDKFMVETDCPYLSPQAYRGKRNEPAYVVEVAKKIAEAKGVDLKEISAISTRNAVNFFGLNGERIGDKVGLESGS